MFKIANEILFFANLIMSLKYFGRRVTLLLVPPILPEVKIGIFCVVKLLNSVSIYLNVFYLSFACIHLFQLRLNFMQILIDMILILL